MTAINVLRSASAVHICTDGLTYPGGKPYLAPKVYVAAPCHWCSRLEG